MRIAVHDYGGYGFIPELSRELANRGHDVLHAFCAEISTGKGNLSRLPSDANSLEFAAVAIGEPMQKYSITKRFKLEHKYGIELGKRIRNFHPDVVLSANTPLFAQSAMLKFVGKPSPKFVFWQQDVVSFAMRDVLVEKLPFAGKHLGKLFLNFERSLLHKADQVIVIAPNFVEVVKQFGVETDDISVIENWAPLDEISPRSKVNAWSRFHNLSDKFVFLYSGVLGIKHNPQLLLDLAIKMRKYPDVKVVVCSEGIGADWLKEQSLKSDFANLVLLPYQDYCDYPDVLGAADVAMSILEPKAGAFSVPSKVLTYLCAGKAILGAIPKDNEAAKLIERLECGIVASPTDVGNFIDAALALYEDSESRQLFGKRAREYAESAFAISVITDKFERVIYAKHE